MDVQYNIFLAKRNIVDSIWKEANIEGIAVTFPETKEIFEGRTVSRLTVNETVAINNLKHGWQFLLEYLDADINVQYIKQINGIVGSQIVSDAGNLRQSIVSIGGTSWKPAIPDYDDINNNLENILQAKKTQKTAMALFCYLSRLQPFNDGNKRTAQLVANSYLIRNGLGVFAIKDENKLEFETKLIKFYETNNPDELINFLLTNCIEYTQNEPQLKQSTKERICMRIEKAASIQSANPKKAHRKTKHNKEI